MARTKEEWTAQANQHADGAMAIMAVFARDGKIEISPSLLHTLLSGSYIEGALAAVNSLGMRSAMPDDCACGSTTGADRSKSPAPERT